ncbi:hypothetical protein [Paucisalibacillus globulus]|uniref:hypothetical protein n=1 Tax=Paucisalibacillus globulus TaxID=351095 RepID=UPI0004038583|nr:hypothetical protein [Paucisalibacillus globulus]
MKANVIKKFRDKNDKQKDGKGKLYKANSVFEASEERVNELSKLGYVDKIVEDGLELEDLLKGAKSHADLDNIVEEIKLEGVPTKDDGATLDERKQAILVAAEKLAEQSNEGE